MAPIPPNACIKKYPLVLVEWKDSRQPAGEWRLIAGHLEDVEVAKCQTVGFLLHSDKQVKVLAASIGDISYEDPQACGIMRIPTSCVVKMRKLK